MFLVVVILFIVIFLLLFLLRRALAALRAAQAGGTTSTGTPPPGIPDNLTATAVAGYLKTRLAGIPADGSSKERVVADAVVWVDRGDEVLVHLDSTTTQVTGQTLLVSIDLETDQTGRTPLVVAFALGSDDTAGLVVATDEYPRGNALLASRWGEAVQAAAWSALLSLARDHAAERGLAPRGLAIAGGGIALIAGNALKIK